MTVNETKVNRYALTLEYNGLAFAGFQLQPNAYTVQQALEEVVLERFREERRVACASRTDAGVHARGQVAIVDLARPLAPQRLMGALNDTLPKTVRVVNCRRVSLDWVPRYRAKYKIYSYLIFNRPVTSFFWEGRAFQVMQPLDVDKMRKAMGYLIGRHDFACFQSSGCQAKHTVRELHAITISRKGPLITFRLQGNAFLYHMVRNIVGSAVQVGKGKWPYTHMKQVLKSRDRTQAGPTAPAYGLYLEKIVFGRKNSKPVLQNGA